ncbi:hypothetical protein [Bathymodiolus japonicus methanotrophic gill symbiont]|uniref:hypothetical protein n=1 Tax=Bathymodiolus japonicus methanotrophic gill symbiont TaxID=113269 RepID=UPI001C8E326E|nr:hypothetical protein [Bathymodiolus japonicus methanotrophic gill symbiont]
MLKEQKKIKKDSGFSVLVIFSIIFFVTEPNRTAQCKITARMQHKILAATS